jgi:hypothetical protein
LEAADLTLSTHPRQAASSTHFPKSVFAHHIRTGYERQRFEPSVPLPNRGDRQWFRFHEGQKGANSMVMGAKVFTATKAKDREELGEVVTRWIQANPRARILDKIVTQSSDSEFHCLTITIFYELVAQ